MSTTYRLVVVVSAFVAAPTAVLQAEFDHSYQAYAQLLSRYVAGARVDYGALKADRQTIDAVVAAFDTPDASDEARWTREQRMAFWINAYNAFTLKAIVEAYPIRAGWFTLQPRNSIRQIHDVWTAKRWQGAGRTVSLDDIEHGILRPTFKDARIHFAVNCASIGCPPLAPEPYRPEQLDAQLDAAARRYLASPQGLQVKGDTLRVSSIFKWYGKDFVDRYASLSDARADAIDRAIRGTIIRHGPPAAVDLARSGSTRIAFLDYDWTLNDIGVLNGIRH